MNNFGFLFLVTLVAVMLVVLLLGVQTLFSKRKKFPNTHVGGNKEMAKRGIYCVQTQDALERRGVHPHRKTQNEEGKIGNNEN